MDWSWWIRLVSCPPLPPPSPPYNIYNWSVPVFWLGLEPLHPVIIEYVLQYKHVQMFVQQFRASVITLPSQSDERNKVPNALVVVWARLEAEHLVPDEWLTVSFLTETQVSSGSDECFHMLSQRKMLNKRVFIKTHSEINSAAIYPSSQVYCCICSHMIINSFNKSN